MPRFDRLLITGAAGALGSVLRDGWSPLARTVRLTDRTDIGELRPHEEILPAELGDFDAVLKLSRGATPSFTSARVPWSGPGKRF